MQAGFAIGLAAFAAALAPGPRPAVARLRRLSVSSARREERGLSKTPGPRRPDAGFLASNRAKTSTAVLVAGAAGWLVGGFAGPLVGIGLGTLAWFGLRRLEPAVVVRARDAATQAIPLVAELLSVAVAAGSPPVVAVEVVADALEGPIAAALRSAAASARVGTDPTAAWMTLAADPALLPLARALAGAVTRGTSPVSVLDRVALDARDVARWAAEARARSLGARAAAPLGLCFLPAFVLVGIVPVVAAAGPLLP